MSHKARNLRILLLIGLVFSPGMKSLSISRGDSKGPVYCLNEFGTPESCGDPVDWACGINVNGPSGCKPVDQCEPKNGKALYCHQGKGICCCAANIEPCNSVEYNKDLLCGPEGILGLEECQTASDSGSSESGPPMREDSTNRPSPNRGSKMSGGGSPVEEDNGIDDKADRSKRGGNNDEDEDDYDRPEDRKSTTKGKVVTSTSKPIALGNCLNKIGKLEACDLDETSCEIDRHGPNGCQSFDECQPGDDNLLLCHDNEKCCCKAGEQPCNTFEKNKEILCGPYGIPGLRACRSDDSGTMMPRRPMEERLSTSTTMKVVVGRRMSGGSKGKEDGKSGANVGRSMSGGSEEGSTPGSNSGAEGSTAGPKSEAGDSQSQNKGASKALPNSGTGDSPSQNKAPSNAAGAGDSQNKGASKAGGSEIDSHRHQQMGGHPAARVDDHRHRKSGRIVGHEGDGRIGDTRASPNSASVLAKQNGKSCFLGVLVLVSTFFCI